MKIFTDLKYTKSHEWVRELGNGLFEIGLSDYAQKELGDIVFVNLPQEGDELKAGETFADLESVKAVSELYAPVSGTVIEINEELEDTPELLNENAYENWIIKVGLVNTGELDLLMNEEEYGEFCKNEQ